VFKEGADSSASARGGIIPLRMGSVVSASVNSFAASNLSSRHSALERSARTFVGSARNAALALVLR
jgi:hypothetical protein